MQSALHAAVPESPYGTKSTKAYCILAGLAAASEQLPVVGDTKAQSEAQMLLSACQAAQTDAWALPLALLLEDASYLAGA